MTWEQAANTSSSATNTSKQASTGYLAGIFSFFYLSEEVALKLLSTLITQVLGQSWLVVFGTYSAVAVASVVGMSLVYKFPVEEKKVRGLGLGGVQGGLDITGAADPLTPAPFSIPSSSFQSDNDFCYKVNSASRLLFNDSKMFLLIPMNAVFGFSAAFLNSYVTGQVLHFATTADYAIPYFDDYSGESMGLDNYVGMFTAIPAGVAAILSLVHGSLSAKTGKGPILIMGAVCFALLASVFLVNPGVTGWTWGPLVAVFCLMGCGRATFESTLRATFADFFAHDLPGAFANIILQSGLSSAFAFFAFPHFNCEEEDDYCVEYKDGSLHDVRLLEVIVIVTAGLAVLGYARAAVIRRREEEEEEEEKRGRAESLGQRV